MDRSALTRVSLVITQTNKEHQLLKLHEARGSNGVEEVGGERVPGEGRGSGGEEGGEGERGRERRRGEGRKEGRRRKYHCTRRVGEMVGLALRIETKGNTFHPITTSRLRRVHSPLLSANFWWSRAERSLRKVRLHLMRMSRSSKCATKQKHANLLLSKE